MNAMQLKYYVFDHATSTIKNSEPLFLEECLNLIFQWGYLETDDGGMAFIYKKENDAAFKMAFESESITQIHEYLLGDGIDFIQDVELSFLTAKQIEDKIADDRETFHELSIQYYGEHDTKQFQQEAGMTPQQIHGVWPQ